MERLQAHDIAIVIVVAGVAGRGHVQGTTAITVAEVDDARLPGRAGTSGIQTGNGSITEISISLDSLLKVIAVGRRRAKTKGLPKLDAGCLARLVLSTVLRGNSSEAANRTASLRALRSAPSNAMDVLLTGVAVALMAVIL